MKGQPLRSSLLERARRRALVLLVLVVAALTAVIAPAGARTGAGKDPDLSGETIRVGDQRGGIKATLQAAGLLDDVPYKVEWTEFQAGPPLVEALNAGEVDVGLVGDVPPVFAAVSGVDLKVIGAVRSNPAGTALLVQPGSGIRSIADLKGKKIAYGKGTAAQYFIVKLLRKAKLSLDDIETVNLLPVDARAAGTSGQVDAWVSFDPLTQLDEQSGDGKALIDGSGLTSGLLFYVARGSAVSEKKAVFADFINRVSKSRVWARQHADEWAQAWSKEIGLPADVLAKVTERAKFQPVPIDTAVIGDVQTIADTFAKTGIIPQRVKVKRLFDTRFNAQLGT